MDNNNKVIEWLLGAENPSVRYRTLTELLDKPPGRKIRIRQWTWVETRLRHGYVFITLKLGDRLKYKVCQTS